MKSADAGGLDKRDSDSDSLSSLSSSNSEEAPTVPSEVVKDTDPSEIPVGAALTNKVLAQDHDEVAMEEKGATSASSKAVYSLGMDSSEAARAATLATLLRTGIPVDDKQDDIDMDLLNGPGDGPSKSGANQMQVSTAHVFENSMCSIFRCTLDSESEHQLSMANGMAKNLATSLLSIWIKRSSTASCLRMRASRNSEPQRRSRSLLLNMQSFAQRWTAEW